MFKKSLLLAGALAAVTVGGAAVAQARDFVSIVDPSTVYPFTAVVAEQFGKRTRLWKEAPARL